MSSYFILLHNFFLLQALKWIHLPKSCPRVPNRVWFWLVMHNLHHIQWWFLCDYSDHKYSVHIVKSQLRPGKIFANLQNDFIEKSYIIDYECLILIFSWSKFNNEFIRWFHQLCNYESTIFYENQCCHFHDKLSFAKNS